ncbi:MAG: hypothetical protein HQL72_14975 [Magnetococcales bacterium]|nr:hypothetical protein [Magnetococcales bacterium]
MSFWNNWRQDKSQKQALRERAMRVHDRLVDRLLVVSGSGKLNLEDGYDLRFNIMVFFAARLLYTLRDDPEFSQEFWEITFEGFQESLRLRGVTDVRMAARMKQVMQDATGRRNVYVVAWENQDGEGLRRAVGRNILNGAKKEDRRIDLLLAAIEGFPDAVMEE